MNRWKIKDWDDRFEFALTVAGIYCGAIYLFGPERLRMIYVYVNQYADGTLGMQILGLIWLAGGLLILGARILQPRPTNLRRLGHALSAGVYFLMALSLGWSIFVGGPAQSGGAFVPYLIVMLMHVYFGTHQPAWRRRQE